MRRLTDEATPLLLAQATDANAQERQLMRPGVLNPLYSIFPALSCISQFLPMETLFSFRLANCQLNDASEKAFLYWVALTILRTLKKIPDQENTLNVIMPRYLRCYLLKTIHIQSEFKNFISGTDDMNEFAGKLFLSQRSELTIELAEKQKHFIQLCVDIGGTSESEIRCNREYLKSKMFHGFISMIPLALSFILLAFAITVFKNKNKPVSEVKMLGAALSISSFLTFAFSAFLIIKYFCMRDEFTSLHTDTFYMHGHKLDLSQCSVRLFKRIADTAQAVQVPVNWMERLSEKVETVVRN